MKNSVCVKLSDSRLEQSLTQEIKECSVSDSFESTIRKLYKDLNNLTSAYVFTVVQSQVPSCSPNRGSIPRKEERKPRTVFVGRGQGAGGGATLQSPFQS